jgi:hypothetical protein
MKKLLLVVTILLVSCGEQSEQKPKQIVWKSLIVKKKYSENQVTKDIVFGTGNWHSTDYYIVDKNNKIWSGISKNDFILCDVGDTLWTDDDYFLQLNKK